VQAAALNSGYALAFGTGAAFALAAAVLGWTQLRVQAGVPAEMAAAPH
jgi:hypothetical protein